MLTHPTPPASSAEGGSGGLDSGRDSRLLQREVGEDGVCYRGPASRKSKTSSLPFHIGSLTQGNHFTQNCSNLNILLL